METTCQHTRQFVLIISTRLFLASARAPADSIFRAMNLSAIFLRKWVVRQRCFEIECDSVSHVAHAKAQSLCQEGTENSECDNKCIEGYTIASNTLKCKAVDLKIASWICTGNVRCTSNSCSVPPSLSNTLHTSVEQHYLDTVIYNCKSGYSLNGLRHGKKEFLLGCKT